MISILIMTTRSQEGPASSPGFLLWHATTRWRRELAARLAPFELTPPQFFLLGSLHWLTRRAGETPSQSRLSEHAGLDPMSTSQGVRALEARGLVRRRDAADDRRAFRLEVTAEGARVALAAIAVVRDVDRSFFAPLGEDRARFIDDLGRLDGEDSDD
jgi:DNA-binding MarR family transcriptional regulator